MIDANEYGKALFELAEEEGMAEELQSQLSEVSALLAANPEYVTLLCTPALPTREKPALVEEALGSCHVYVRDAVKLLAAERAVGCLPAILEAYGRQMDDSLGIVRATAVSALPLDEAQKQRLTAKLSEMTGKQVVLECRCDEKILGGIELICDGTRFDGSIRARLQTLRRQLVGTHI